MAQRVSDRAGSRTQDRLIPILGSGAVSAREQTVGRVRGTHCSPVVDQRSGPSLIWWLEARGREQPEKEPTRLTAHLSR